MELPNQPETQALHARDLAIPRGAPWALWGMALPAEMTGECSLGSTQPALELLLRRSGPFHRESPHWCWTD